MSVADAIRAELDALDAADVSPFDVHSHTGVDVDGSARSAEEHVRELERIGGRSVIFPLCVNGLTTLPRSPHTSCIAWLASSASRWKALRLRP